MIAPLATLSKQSETVRKSRGGPSPQTYLDNRVTNSHQGRAKKPRLQRSARAESRLNTKRHLVALTAEINERELSESIARCHSKLAVLTCGRHVSKIIPNHTCEFKLCPYCAHRRSRKLLNKYHPLVEPFVQRHRVTPVHLVLTQTHRPETLKDSIKRLKSAFNKLIRRKFWLSHFEGGLWAVEVTLDKDGLYHTHLHVLAFRSKFFDIKLLKSAWKEVTGDSHVLRLDVITDSTAGVREVLKYVVKPLSVAELQAGHLRDFMKLKNVRFVSTFGTFRDFCREYSPSDNDTDALSTDLENPYKDLTEGCACPHCDEPLFELRMGGGDLPDFLRKIEAAAPKSKSPPS